MILRTFGMQFLVAPKVKTMILLTFGMQILVAPKVKQ
jgi:hypothetical protein